MVKLTSTGTKDMENYVELLRLCKERMLDLERTNRDFSIKALGVVIFGDILFCAAAIWMYPVHTGFAEWMLLGTLGVLSSFVAAWAFFFIIIPGDWDEPPRVSQVKEKAAVVTNDALVEKLSDHYVLAVEANEIVVSRRGSALRLITVVAAFELPALVSLVLIHVNPF